MSLPPAITAITPPSLLSTTTPVSHQYGTRIRSNSVIRPSARLRQSPDPLPRRLKSTTILKARTPFIAPDPASYAVSPFPPSHITLHSDDLNSKVFLAMGRAFMSVNNCAMTIKDLAVLSMKSGLSCQNPSAAAQAITTYIRNHLQRCDTQQDHPLLLRHTMSGTLSDDELAPALHSRVGGAHCVISVAENRVTNFRRGTIVWYLSKAAGAPCPFVRGGINLSDYGENGRVGAILNPGKERKRERDRLRRAEQCGQKRKRLFRACADNRTSDADSSDDDPRPAKVKLTLRLKPFLASGNGSVRIPSPTPSGCSSTHEIIDLSRDDSDPDSMSVDSSGSEEELDPLEDDTQSPPCTRSPSLEERCPSLRAGPPDLRSCPSSAASDSSPTDSEDEPLQVDPKELRSAMSGRPIHHPEETYEDEDELDSDFLSMREWDLETHWEESPGPRSPSASFEDNEAAAQEPRDVQGLLDAWEDFDLAVTDKKVIDIVAQAAASLESGLAPADPSGWSWQEFTDDPAHDLTYGTLHELSAQVKEEEIDFVFETLDLLDFLPISETSPSTTSAYSPAPGAHDDPTICSAKENAERQNTEITDPDHAQRQDQDNIAKSSLLGDGNVGRFIPSTDTSKSPISSQTGIDGSAVGGGKDEHHRPITGTAAPNEPCDIATPAASPPTPEPRTEPISGDEEAMKPKVIHPHQPCVPAVCATVWEGIPVYQMTLGSFLLLRRIDTDYVNISPIQEFLGLEPPGLVLQTAFIVSQGSSDVCGTWIPAEATRHWVYEHPLLGAFLSDDLRCRFPPCLDDLLTTGTSKDQPKKSFGTQFHSTAEAKREMLSTFKLDLSQDSGTPWTTRKDSPWDVEDHLLSVHPPFALASAIRVTPVSFSEAAELETPLSPTEEEMFHTLCSVPDWDGMESDLLNNQPPTVLDVVADSAIDRNEPPHREPILRRSKRVPPSAAVSMVTRSRSRSYKNGLRSSLSCT